jgi:hypothetical protein
MAVLEFIERKQDYAERRPCDTINPQSTLYQSDIMIVDDNPATHDVLHV